MKQKGSLIDDINNLKITQTAVGPNSQDPEWIEVEVKVF